MFLKTFFFCILFIVSTLFVKAQPDAFSVIMPGGRTIKLGLTTVNNHDYFSFKEIGRRLFPGSMLISGGTEISFKNTLLRTAPSGFFVVFENPDGGITAQMNLPALKIGQELYVPAPNFLEVFERLGIYSVAKSEHNKITFAKSRTVIAQQMDEELLKESPGDDGEIGEEIPAENISPGPGPKPFKKSNDKTVLQKSVDDYKPAVAPALKNLKSGWPENASAKPQTKTATQTKASQPKISAQPKPVQAEIPKKDSVSLPGAIIPNHYMLPRDLKRRALERGQDGGFFYEAETGNGNISNSMYYKPSYKIRSRYYASLSLMLEPDRAALTDIDIIEKKNSTQIIFKSKSTIADFHKPELVKKTLTFRIPDALVLFKTENLFKDHALVKSFKTAQVRDYAVFTLTLHDTLLKATARRISAGKIALELFKNNSKTDKTIAEKKNSTESPKEETTREKNSKDKWKLDVIVIDPGHGGEDAGAISINGFKEKDITLAVSKKIEQLLKKRLPETKVVLTRHDDTFIELYRRGQIANESKGKLFISIHCNSMPKKPHPANGFETYILRPGRNDDAVRVADRENSAVKFEDEQKRYKKLTDEQLIVATMAQSAFVKFSEHFAETLQKEVARATPLHSRGVSQAGFFVLVGASMPNVLFETAFLSNEEDEEFLASEKGQQKIAEGIVKAIEKYAAEYGELLKTK